MGFRKVDVSKCEKKELIELIDELQLKLQKKKLELQTTREKLQSARKRMIRAQESVHYQRNRIIELYNSKGTTGEPDVREAVTVPEQRLR